MNEATARIKINKLLEAAGWRFFADGNKPANICLETGVTIKASDLDSLGNDFEKTSPGFIDFLLLDAKGFPLIVLEAKSEDKNPLVGKEQARKYARSQNCRFVILSNGNLHYFWDLDRGNPYIITSFPTPASVSDYRKITPNPQRLITEQVSEDYIALTHRPHYASEAAWKNEAERPGFIKANNLRFLRAYQLRAIHADWRQLEFPATTNRNPRFFRADPDHEDMVKDQQVRRLVKLKKNEKTLTMAAARAGLSRKTARKYLKSGKLPSQCQPERYWRTRSDPFESVWPEVEEILKRSPTVEATAVFEYLCRQQEGAFQQGQLRTLQRRIKQWKVEHGEAKEVMFPQKYRPGHQAQSDFTFMGRLGVTIQGQPFPHLLYHFVLAYSNWEATTLCFSESFESLSLGLQNALWELGALPEEHRTDRLSAAVNNLKREEFTERYQGLLNHFGMRSSRTQAGKAHENGDVEQAHHRLKRAIEQELLLRCSRDFSSREEYEGFVAVIVARRNAARQKRLGEELAVMRPLPARRLDDFTRQWVKVSPSSTIRVRHNTYSVDSRLIGERVQVRVWADQLEVYYGGQRQARMPRLRGEGKHRIDYRHVIHSLVRKPGAFLRYRWREDLFPGILFRVAYDELRQDCPATADRQYLKILELAAQEGEQRVREALQGLIERGQNIRFEALRECLVDPVVEPWEVAVEKMDVGLYDTLLESREVRS